MRNNILVSIVIATYNSGHLLPKVLDSVNKQSYKRSRLEILVVDGGSTDNTREIAKSFGCTVINNSKILPAWAKFIGYKEAKGKYIMYLDSDEIIVEKDSIKRKIDLLESKSSVHAVTGSGYKNPTHYPFLNQYINEFGDPFSFFIYRLSKDNRFFIPAMKKRYAILEEDNNQVIFDFSTSRILPIFELVAMGSVVDAYFLKANFPEIIKNPGLIPHFFNLLISRGSQIGIIKNDPLLHYSSNTLKNYLRKINSRIISNLFTPAKDGFSGRNEFSKGMSRYKRFLFIPYALSLVFPFIDAVYLSLTRRNINYFFHIFFSLYTAALILCYLCLKAVHIRPILKSYGGELIKK